METSITELAIGKKTASTKKGSELQTRLKFIAGEYNIILGRMEYLQAVAANVNTS